MFLPQQKYIPAPATLNPASTVCPVSHLDINSVGIVNSAKSLDFTNVDGTYKQTLFLVVSRTPLTPNDPNTYIALPPNYQPNKSKIFADYSFALTSNANSLASGADGTSADTSGSGSGSPAAADGAGKDGADGTNANSSSSNSKEKNTIEANTVPAQASQTAYGSTSSNSATGSEKLPFGSNVNPLLPDPFKFVHLTPGCNNHYVKIKYTNPTNATIENGAGKNKLWGKKIGGVMSNIGSNGSGQSVNELKLPKSPIVRNSSTFLTRALPVENFSKKLNSSESVMFNYNGKVFNLYSVRPNTSAKIANVNEIVDDSPLIRVVFASTISCVASKLSYISKSSKFSSSLNSDSGNSSSNNSNLKLDILIGFISGDIFWYDPFVNKYTRFNKNGNLVNGSAVLSLKWLNNGQNFLAAFADGSILTFSRSKDDDENHFYNVIKNKNINKNSSSNDNNNNDNNNTKFLRVLKSAKDVDQNTLNPISHYKLSKSPITSVSLFAEKNISALPVPKDGPPKLSSSSKSSSTITIPALPAHASALNSSPFKNLLSITSDDGLLRIFDIANETLTDIIPSYFSSLLCSAWSPDGKYLAVGGQDDLISIFEVGYNYHYFQQQHQSSAPNSPARIGGTTTPAAGFSRGASFGPQQHSQFRLVARLEGHYSWIRSIKFDYVRSPPNMVTSPVTYRIGSAGDDGKFLYWDFSPRLLPKIKTHQRLSRRHHHHHHHHSHHAGSVKGGANKSSSGSGTLTRRRSNTASSRTKIDGFQLPINSNQQQRSLAQAMASPMFFPKQPGPASNSNVNAGAEANGSVNRDAATTSLPVAMTRSNTGAGTGVGSTQALPFVHDVTPKSMVPFVQPVIMVDCGLGRLTSVQFTDDGIWITSAGGDIRKWDRPRTT